MKNTYIPVIILVSIGVLMVYSASTIWAEYKLGDPYYYLIRQGIFASIGIFLMFLFSKIDCVFYKQKANYIFFGCLLLLVLVLIPGIGLVRGGARSWINLGIIQIQPSEFMKLGLIVFVSKYISKNDVSKLKDLIIILSILGFCFLLIMLEPDLGSGLVMLMSIVFLLFAGGIKVKWLLLLGIIGIVGFAILVIIAPYRVDRILAFLNPWDDPLGTGFQTIQSLYALSPGGFFGLGLFNSRQKFYYLPEPQTDFIFAIIAEELGFLGILFIFILFFIIFFKGILIAVKTKDSFSSMLAFGITGSIFIQFFINVGVVIGLLPVTGITLPFLSYGGSSLVLSLVMIGILLSIERKNVYENNY